MYREFGLIGIKSSLSEKTITVEFSLDIDPASATLDALILCEKDSGRIVPLDIFVKKNQLEIKLKEWPKTNSDYLLRIHPKSIRSIVDDELPESAQVQRTIVFKSTVTSSIEITAPSHQEVIRDVMIEWEEHAAIEDQSGILASSYYLEIAKENAFYNIVYSTNIKNKNNIHLPDIEEGQYYLRIRAQIGEDYGKWSETTTFVFKKEKNEEKIEEPIYVKKIKTISVPEDGKTPERFIFVFDNDLDMNCIPTIRIKRRGL